MKSLLRFVLVIFFSLPLMGCNGQDSGTKDAQPDTFERAKEKAKDVIETSKGKTTGAVSAVKEKAVEFGEKAADTALRAVEVTKEAVVEVGRKTAEVVEKGVEATKETVGRAVGKAASGKKEVTVETVPAVSEAAPVTEVLIVPQGASRPAVVLARGRAVYEQSCASCHGAGVAGAPKLGDQAAWKDRINQGLRTLESRSISGFQGKFDFMPAKGGNAALSDKDVKAAVAYMVEQAR